MKYRRAVLAISVLLAVLWTPPQAAVGSPAPAVKPGARKVIIVLRQQFAGLSDTPAGATRRTAAVAASQHGVLAELTAAHARGVKSISLVNAVAATVSPAAVSRIEASPARETRRRPSATPAPGSRSPISPTASIPTTPTSSGPTASTSLSMTRTSAEPARARRPMPARPFSTRVRSPPRVGACTTSLTTGSSSPSPAG